MARLRSAAAALALLLCGAPAAMARDGYPPEPGACDGRLCYAESIAPFLAKLRADPRRAHVPVHIIQIGDSHTAGDMITNGWRMQLQARYGNGGRGVLAGGKPYGGYLTWGVTASQTPGWVVNATFGKAYSEYGPELGISGFTQSVAAPGERLSIAADSPDQYFDQITVCAMTSPGAGAVLLRMGMVAEEEWRLASVERQPACRTMRTRTKVASAEIVTLDEGPVSITSFATFRSDGGVVLSNLGVVGSQAIHLNRASDAVVRAEFQAYAPDLIVLAFGTNEGFAPNFAIDNYETQLRRQVARIRRLAGPNVPILLLGAPDAATRNVALRPEYDCGEGLGPPRSLGEVRARQIRVAHDMRLGFWNWAAAMGSQCAAYSWKTAGQMRGDFVHFTREGGTMIGQMLDSDLTRASLAVRPAVLRPRLTPPLVQVSAGNMDQAEEALRDRAGDAPPGASEVQRP
ncbi:SGNH/GDSL hydrolase family protein [Sphingomonas canadensis]|uniref:SGNH/GDSL hydrolase family protein n=1 Tax=Sphingomonas canadensis TaxID=1219257 RepID=A0ABW3H6P3_9SPHN|nr:SGNH/GDSL hydrolase family protein [Sphingomonas canadensis]MCW3836753.1 SGNH/GDSL hydrolase family protein [Sphingomonas canadensis]